MNERFYIHVSSETTTPPAADEVVEILAEVAKFLIEKEKEKRCNWQPYGFMPLHQLCRKNDFVEVAKFKFQKLNQVHTYLSHCQFKK